jgi:hypothetical protein
VLLVSLWTLHQWQSPPQCACNPSLSSVSTLKPSQPSTLHCRVPTNYLERYFASVPDKAISKIPIVTPDYLFVASIFHSLANSTSTVAPQLREGVSLCRLPPSRLPLHLLLIGNSTPFHRAINTIPNNLLPPPVNLPHVPAMPILRILLLPIPTILLPPYQTTLT